MSDKVKEPKENGLNDYGIIYLSGPINGWHLSYCLSNASPTAVSMTKDTVLTQLPALDSLPSQESTVTGVITIPPMIYWKISENMSMKALR